jgi:hypothetical protein
MSASLKSNRGLTSAAPVLLAGGVLHRDPLVRGKQGLFLVIITGTSFILADFVSPLLQLLHIQYQTFIHQEACGSLSRPGVLGAYGLSRKGRQREKGRERLGFTGYQGFRELVSLD